MHENSFRFVKEVWNEARCVERWEYERSDGLTPWDRVRRVFHLFWWFKDEPYAILDHEAFWERQEAEYPDECETSLLPPETIQSILDEVNKEPEEDDIPF